MKLLDKIKRLTNLKSKKNKKNKKKFIGEIYYAINYNKKRTKVKYIFKKRLDALRELDNGNHISKQHNLLFDNPCLYGLQIKIFGIIDYAIYYVIDNFNKIKLNIIRFYNKINSVIVKYKEINKIKKLFVYSKNELIRTDGHKIGRKKYGILVNKIYNAKLLNEKLNKLGY